MIPFLLNQFKPYCHVETVHRCQLEGETTSLREFIIYPSLFVLMKLISYTHPDGTGTCHRVITFPVAQFYHMLLYISFNLPKMGWGVWFCFVLGFFKAFFKQAFVIMFMPLAIMVRETELVYNFMHEFT